MIDAHWNLSLTFDSKILSYRGALIKIRIAKWHSLSIDECQGRKMKNNVLF
jgi:hypothetical protein